MIHHQSKAARPLFALAAILLAAVLVCGFPAHIFADEPAVEAAGDAAGDAAGETPDADKSGEEQGDADVDGDVDGETAADTETEEKKEVTIRGGGWFLADWFGKALRWISDFFHSYLVGILIFALLVKIVLFPLSIKQQKNSQKMAKLAPRQEAIRKKYAGRTDRATQMKMNEEIQQMYADEKFNPMGGCLPLLLQLPVIMALYTAITSPLTTMLGYTTESLKGLSTLLLQTPNFSEIAGKTITQSDAISRIAANGLDAKISAFYNEFQVLSVNLMDNPNFSSLLLVVPVLVFLSSFFSTKIIRKFTYNPNAGTQQDASMKIMDWTMPLMVLWFSFSVPALVGIYWVFQNIISILQQIALWKLFPVKAPTPEEIREAELLIKGKKSRNVIEDRGEEAARPERPKKQPVVSKAALKKKKANSPFIYAKKGIDEAYLARVKRKGVTPKAKKRP